MSYLSMDTTLVFDHMQWGDSTYPMVMESWKTTSCSSYSIYWGIMNSEEGKSSGLTQMCIYVYGRSNLHMYINPSLILVATLQYRTWWKDL